MVSKKKKLYKYKKKQYVVYTRLKHVIVEKIGFKIMCHHQNNVKRNTCLFIYLKLTFLKRKKNNAL